MTSSRKVHYLPHREVLTLDKNTTNLRIVYDASARRGGSSLHDCLYSELPLTPMIFDVIARFGAHRVAQTADIEHRDYLRILWVDDSLTKNPSSVTMQFTRVVFGVDSSPFLLNGTISHHLNSYIDKDPEFVEQNVRSLHVDDLASSKPDGASSYDFYWNLKAGFKVAGLNMWKWMTNDPELPEKIRSEEDQRVNQQKPLPKFHLVD